MFVPLRTSAVTSCQTGESSSALLVASVLNAASFGMDPDTCKIATVMSPSTASGVVRVTLALVTLLVNVAFRLVLSLPSFAVILMVWEPFRMRRKPSAVLACSKVSAVPLARPVRVAVVFPSSFSVTVSVSRRHR